MPTLPPEQGNRSEPQPHHHRHVAESFGTDAERYDRARPSYPDDLIQRIVAAIPGPAVVDAGCGTGIAARQLQAAGCQVLGVEPDIRMADWARQRGLEVEVATFETWDPAGRTFDAVVAAQAWHWVDPVAGAAKAAEALRPDGRLVAFWNVEQPPAELGAALAEVYQRILPDSLASRWSAITPQAAVDGYSQMCAKAADAMRQTGAFGESEQWRFEWDRSCTRDEWLDVLPTLGGQNQLPAAALAEVLAAAGDAIDRMGGSFTTHYTTLAVSAARLHSGQS